MSLTRDEIIDRIEAFLAYSKRVQELKDSLLEVSTLCNPSELERNERFRLEVTEEIGTIYQDHMATIIKELMDHVEENASEIRAALERLKGADLVALVDQTLADHKKQRLQQKAQDEEEEAEFEIRS